jgi:hypothetical protein
MKINIDEATASQLAEFASAHLGLDVHFKQGKDHIRAKLAQVGFTGAEIEVADPTPPTAAEAATAAKDEAARRKIKILIPQQETPGGKEAASVRVNGKVALIKRGQPVDVPEEYVEALNNAKTVQYDIGPNGEPINPTLVPRIPFSVLSA